MQIGLNIWQGSAPADRRIDKHMKVVDGTCQIMKVFHPPLFVYPVSFAQFIGECIQRSSGINQGLSGAISFRTALMAAVTDSSIRDQSPVFKNAAL